MVRSEVFEGKPNVVGECHSLHYGLCRASFDMVFRLLVRPVRGRDACQVPSRRPSEVSTTDSGISSAAVSRPVDLLRQWIVLMCVAGGHVSRQTLVFAWASSSSGSLEAVLMLGSNFFYFYAALIRFSAVTGQSLFREASKTTLRGDEEERGRSESWQTRDGRGEEDSCSGRRSR